MKTLPSALTPFVRSDAVGALLAETLGHPDQEFSLAELGRRTGVSGPVVHREVNRLVEAAVLTERTEGRNRLVRADLDHPLYAPMREIIDATYGPVPVLREALASVSGVERALVYGSWAARRTGEPGPFPGDIDVLVIGEASRRDVSRAGGSAEERLDMPVSITRLTREEWEAPEPTPFVATVRSRPVIDLEIGAADA